MSLAKRNNGCLECRTRRVICDKTEPECFKCRKKGLKCSGQGIECRFSPYMRQKLNVAQVTASTTAATSSQAAAPAAEGKGNATKSGLSRKSSAEEQAEATSSRQYLWVDSVPSPSLSPPLKATPVDAAVVPKIEEEPEPVALLDMPAHCSIPSPSSSSSSQFNERYIQDRKGKGPLSPSHMQASQKSLVLRRTSVKSRPWPYATGPGTAIQSVSADSRFFFDHFSNFIASKMVVLDFDANGYRQMILPLATQDPMVSQAVSTVSAFHLSQVVPSLRMKAEVNQQQILSRLRRTALMPNPEQFFKLSTWVTILVLLVGDTITGSKNYVYLLELLSQLSRAALSDKSLPEDVKQFVTQQTQMFMLLGSPLCSEQKGLEIMQRRTADYLSFMSYSPSSPEQQANILIMTEAINQACDIFQNRASKKVTPESSFASIERMRQIVMDMDPNADGCHALVWPFFIAAAESSSQEHRDFFYERLQSLFSCTRFGSIPVALETLKYIWSKSDSTSWTDIVTTERQVLIL